MFGRSRRLLRQFFERTSTLNNEPLNKVSLIVVILIDIFILSNVFLGLNDISQWPLSPSQAYPCYSEWQSYTSNTENTKDFTRLETTLNESLDVLNSIPYASYSPPKSYTTFQEQYQDQAREHIGELSPICLQYAQQKDGVRNDANRNTLSTINQKRTEISNIEQANNQIRQQYDSTLLEEIAGQPRDQSINAVAARNARQTLDQNNQKITTLKADIKKFETTLLTNASSASYLAFLKNNNTFAQLKKDYDRASFWHPTTQLILQALFLLPLIVVTGAIHRHAQRRNYGLVALISWHLLVIFFVPLIFKVFQFLQVGAIFQIVFDALQVLLGGLLFLVSYVYILLIPLVGFGIIKFFQSVVFNPRIQAANRVQKSKCLRCAKKIRPDDLHCPHCSYDQLIECPNCHQGTYKLLPYCKHCGYGQPLSDRLPRTQRN
jgi:hypothetical protein